MNKFLQKFRIVFAAIFFLVILAGFLHLSGGNAVSKMALRTQFTPAFVALFTGGGLSFIFLMILTLLFGRVYCSFLCPLGILQDIITRISNFFRKLFNKGKKVSKKNKGYKKPHNILRYGILAIIVICLVFGFMYPVALLDPYSNFGKIASQLFASVELSITNLLSNIFPSVFYYQQYVRISMYAFVYSLFFFLVVAVFSAFRGRLYCNTICPVGSFLGLLSGFSLFKPTINKDKCVKCTLCATNCKSNCINLETKEIDATRCVACYNCLTSCKRGGISLSSRWFKSHSAAAAKENAQNPAEQIKEDATHRDLESPERRNALIAMGGFAAALAARSIIKPKSDYPTQADNNEKDKPIMPPGAGNLEAFKDACTACHACIAACPNKIIKPATFEYGLDGIMLPTIKYDKKFCAYECNLCTTLCPHGALKHISLEEKQITQIGRARFYAKNCIVFKDGTDCGACDEHCPTKAITMTPVKGKPGLYFPKLNRDMCIGCGGCEYVCPGTPKAMKIEGRTVQVNALPPKIDKQEDLKVNDFGF